MCGLNKDVDGCGTDAEVVVRLDVKSPLTDTDKKKLEDAIQEMQETWDPDDWDTDSVVEAALKKVFGVDVEYEVVLPDIEVTF
jgi:hypothetical protein